MEPLANRQEGPGEGSVHTRDIEGADILLQMDQTLSKALTSDSPSLVEELRADEDRVEGEVRDEVDPGLSLEPEKSADKVAGDCLGTDGECQEPEKRAENAEDATFSWTQTLRDPTFRGDIVNLSQLPPITSPEVHAVGLVRQSPTQVEPSHRLLHGLAEDGLPLTPIALNLRRQTPITPSPAREGLKGRRQTPAKPLGLQRNL